ncbi:MAG: tetratricopeptide repeat protein [Desulfosporosinus sp.]|nr:tetratricopeptide repeat protein [Desulfosporosinus sp.]
MNNTSNLFKSLSNIIHVVTGGKAKLDSPSDSISTSELQPEEQSGGQNGDLIGNISTVIDNTKALERLAAQQQLEDQTQINTGAKAFNNQEYDLAIVHYKQAIAINPSDGSIYNNIGNVYLRGKEDAATALQYYIEATKIQPSFNYGWINLALCQRELGDLPGAKTTISNGLNALNDEDALYSVLVQLQSELN